VLAFLKRHWVLLLCVVVLAGMWFLVKRKPVSSSSVRDPIEGVFMASEATLAERYGPGEEFPEQEPAEKVRIYRAGSLMVIAYFWNGRAEKVSVAKINREPLNAEEHERILAQCGGGWERVGIMSDGKSVEWRRPDAWARTFNFPNALVMRTLKFFEAEEAARKANGE
jgi:hypothetical protein